MDKQLENHVFGKLGDVLDAFQQVDGIENFINTFERSMANLLPEVEAYGLWKRNESNGQPELVFSKPDTLDDDQYLRSQLISYLRGAPSADNGMIRSVSPEKLESSKTDGDNLLTPAEMIIAFPQTGRPTTALYARVSHTSNGEYGKRPLLELFMKLSIHRYHLVLNDSHSDIAQRASETGVNPADDIYEIFDYLPLNIYTKDLDGRFVFLNQHALQTIGREAGELLGKTYEDVFPSKLARQLEEIDNKTIESEKNQKAHIEVTINGVKYHMVTGRKLIQTKNKDPLILAYSIDISDTIDFRENIEKQRRFIEKVIDTDPNYIYLKDRDGNFLMVNDAVANLFNTTKEAFLMGGKTLIENHAVDVVLNQETDRQVIETGATVEAEEKLVLPDGEVRWIQTTKKPFIDRDDEVKVLGISVDITDIKRHSEELEKARKAKEQFLAKMSHEIRTPINGIVGMTKLLEATPTLPDQRRYIEAIKRSSEALQVLINDMLDLSVIESGNIRLDYIGFKPKSLLNTLIESFRYAAQEKNLQLTLNYDPFISEVLIGDPTRLYQILLNLIGNAIKFTDNGYVRVYVLKLNEDYSTNRLQFIVEDSGIGIPEKNIARIFESFEQADDNIAHKFGGTGLGLAIVKQLVDLQKGQIHVESKEKQGTKFTLELRFDVGTEEDLDRRKIPSNKSGSQYVELDLSPYRVLLVEDNEVNLLYSRMILEKWGCKLDTATNGLEALELLKQHQYDLILMDVLMPNMNGIETAKFIRTNFNPPKSSTKIIAITANAVEADVKKYLEVGMNDYLSKPFKPEELKMVMAKQLGLESSTAIDVEQKKEMDSEKVTNLAYLKKISDNDTSFIAEMVKSFMQQSPVDLEIVRQGVREKNWEQVANTVHRIKPSINFMGIETLKQVVADIQESANSGAVENIPALAKTLENVIEKSIAELRKELKSIG